MKRTLTLAACVLVCITVTAQKKVLDHTVYDGWQSTTAPVLTDDGRIMAYQITPQQGDAELVIVETATGRELKVERGGAATL
ncbi:MAG: hypothetical protein IJL42_07980, partial [Bacteroidales bacterium]|nr:hypothetical protein [Bacteroidales bacterium]